MTGPFACARCGAPSRTYHCDRCFPATTDRKDTPMHPTPIPTLASTIGGIGPCFGPQQGQEGSGRE